jgi:DNA topoisomerase-1
MGKKLVIVESPAKAKTINKILGKDYVVKSSVGHIRDLPEKKLGVDVKNEFKPSYVLSKGKKKVVDELRKAVTACDEIYLAPDPDREGEAIAWHLQAALAAKAKDKPFFRVQYNEITPTAVKAAFDNPGEINMDRVDAQQARRILDRIVGFKVSQMLWRRLKRGLSAGRVQSVALRLVCEREQQIRDFIPEKYWVFGANVRKLIAPLDPFEVKLTKIDGEKAEIKSQELSENITADLEQRKLRVATVKTRDVTRKAPPPFITSSLQQAASNKYQFSPRRTMEIAQKLYEGMDSGSGAVGLITYMRTDSVSVSKDAISSVRDYITQQIGDKYCPAKPNFYKSRGSAQEAHEAVRPTDVNRTPDSIKGKIDPVAWKLYDLIWRRFVASQMEKAIVEQRSAEIDAVLEGGNNSETPPRSYTFRASVSSIKFAGYMKVSGTDIGKKPEEGELSNLPEVKEGEYLECLEWLQEEKETAPPARFSEASLVKEMEQNGVGRPSTYAQTISTLSNREYIERQNRSLMATDLGMQVSEFLTLTLDSLFNVKFTADMENKLDEIENGKIDWKSMLADFYGDFEKWMEATKAPPADQEMVRKVLDALEDVTDWAPEVQRGKRKYSDKIFVDSIRTDLDNSEKQISERQFEALMKIACYYHNNSSRIDDVIKETGFDKLLSTPEFQPPQESTIRKMELLANVEMDESGRNFIDSLRARVQGHRCLTPAQLNALNNVVVANSTNIPNFEEIKESLGLGDVEIVEDKESGVLLGVLGKITEWREPVKKGKRTYDDKSFYESLNSQYASKKFLSVRQQKALRGIVERYASSIPNYDELADAMDLKPLKNKSEKVEE